MSVFILLYLSFSPLTFSISFPFSLYFSFPHFSLSLSLSLSSSIYLSQTLLIQFSFPLSLISYSFLLDYFPRFCSLFYICTFVNFYFPPPLSPFLSLSLSFSFSLCFPRLLISFYICPYVTSYFLLPFLPLSLIYLTL